jgi:hypothetical protein
MQDRPGLRKVITELSMEAASQAFESPNKSERLASAISIATLFTAGQFSATVAEHLRSLPRESTEHDLSERSFATVYDVAVVEAAAFCYFQLLRLFFRDEDKPPEGGHLFACLKDSMAMTADFVDTRAGFQLSPDFFMDRARFYERHVLEDEYDKFEETLIDSIGNGSPALPKQFREALQGELAVDVAVRLNARIFIGTSVSSLIEFSDRLSKRECDDFK